MTPGAAASQQVVDAIVASGPYARAVWDFDGVMADSEPLQGEAYRTMLEGFGIHPEPDFFNEYIGRTETEIWTSIRERYGIATSVAELRAARIEVFLARAKQSLRPNWFVRPLMAGFRGQGTAQWIVSSGNREVIEVLLSTWQIDSGITKIVSSDASNADTYSKRLAIEEAIRSSPGKTILIEDHPQYLALGAALGVATVAVRHGLNDLAGSAADFVLSTSEDAG
jgi:beta-phosphoglucomutase-like phosphatase (HAD superfamily)